MQNAAFKWVDLSVSVEENRQKLETYIRLFVLLEENRQKLLPDDDIFASGGSFCLYSSSEMIKSPPWKQLLPIFLEQYAQIDLLDAAFAYFLRAKR